MIRATSRALCFSLVLFLNVQAQMQNAPVFCYPAVGSVNCTEGEASMMTYEECCTRPNATDIYYRINGSSDEQCNICGPVFLEDQSYPSFVTSTVLTIEWKLHPSSIGVSRYQSLYYEVGKSLPEQAIPILVEPPALSQQFLGLTVGTKYVFSVTARGGNGGLSELKLTWEAGKSHLPTFTNFTETEVAPSSVMAEWFLRFSGVFPIEQMSVRWRIGTDVNFPEGNVVTFDYTNNSTTLPVGTVFRYTFQNLRPAMIYVVKIEGSNHLGTSSTLFVIETGEVPAVIGLSSSAGSHTWISTRRLPLMLWLLLTLTAVVQHGLSETAG